MTQHRLVGAGSTVFAACRECMSVLMPWWGGCDSRPATSRASRTEAWTLIRVQARLHLRSCAHAPLARLPCWLSPLQVNFKLKPAKLLPRHCSNDSPCCDVLSFSKLLYPCACPLLHRQVKAQPRRAWSSLSRCLRFWATAHPTPTALPTFSSMVPTGSTPRPSLHPSLR